MLTETASCAHSCELTVMYSRLTHEKSYSSSRHLAVFPRNVDYSMVASTGKITVCRLSDLFTESAQASLRPVAEGWHTAMPSIK